MYLVKHTLSIVNGATGNSTTYTDEPINGLLHSIEYVVSTAPMSSDATITFKSETSDLTLYETTGSTGDWSRCPRLNVARTPANVSLGTTTPVGKIPIAGERIKCTVAAGSSATTGTFYIFTEGGA